MTTENAVGPAISAGLGALNFRNKLRSLNEENKQTGVTPNMFGDSGFAEKSAPLKKGTGTKEPKAEGSGTLKDDGKGEGGFYKKAQRKGGDHPEPKHKGDTSSTAVSEKKTTGVTPTLEGEEKKPEEKRSLGTFLNEMKAGGDPSKTRGAKATSGMTARDAAKKEIKNKVA